MRAPFFLVVLIVIVAAIFWPLVIIWAFNTLFGTTIPNTLATWFSVLVLTGTLRVSAGK